MEDKEEGTNWQEIIRATLESGLEAQSGLEANRGYLGMSQISECPVTLYHYLHDGRPLDQRSHWFCWTGYQHERMVLELLGIERLEQLELIANFDTRFRGHVDHVLDSTTMLEIKSTSWNNLQRVSATGRIPFRSFAQVQTYMRHGNFSRCVMVYIARDVPYMQWSLPFFVTTIKPNPNVQDAMDKKAATVLQAWDTGIAPKCECGKCQESDRG